MSDDPFAAYRLPKGITHGTRIEIPETDAYFVVKLPSTANEEFQTRLLAAMDLQVGQTVKPIDLQVKRKELFFETCILEAHGLPTDVDAFFDEYQIAAQLVWDRAQELAEEADLAVEDALKKSKPSPSGNTSGEGEKSNIKTLSKRGSNRKPKSPMSAA